MIPVLVSPRANMAGWYAFHYPNESRYVVWDGGINRYTASGVWDALTKTPIFVDDVWINRMPNMPLAGFLKPDGEFLVHSVPTVSYVVQRFGRTNNTYQVTDLIPEGSPAYFLKEWFKCQDLLDGDQCRFVPIQVLPDDHDSARARLIDLGPHAMARHPMSVWTDRRTFNLVSTITPPKKRLATIEQVMTGDSDTDGKQRVSSYDAVLRGNGQPLSFRPMYDVDLYLGGESLQTGNYVQLYLNKDENNVVGYE